LGINENLFLLLIKEYTIGMEGRNDTITPNYN